MIYITRKQGDYTLLCVVNDELIIELIITALKADEQPALRWLGVWFDKKLTFKRHVSERAAKAKRVVYHI
jgi:hypothetical protein